MVVLEPNVTRESPSEQSLAVFNSESSPPWCRKLFQDPNLCPIATTSRKPKSTTEDSFVAETLATPSTISAWQSFYRTQSSQSNAGTNQDSAPVAGELISLLALGAGINGHTDIAHGGLLSLILDETLGTVVARHILPSKSAFTVSLNVSFKKPVPTPCIVFCRTWLEKRSSGRKYWVRGTIEDGQGMLYAEAEGLWIAVDRHQKL